jgi:hypothetical protein
MSSGRFVTKYKEDATIQDGVKKAFEKQDAIDEQRDARKTFELNLELCKINRENEKARVYTLSSIYLALMSGIVIKSGDKISVVKKTTREPISLVIRTTDGRMETIPYLEKYLTQDFRLREELQENDEGKKWVEVEDKENESKFYLVSKR